MSGDDLAGRVVRKGAVDAVAAHVQRLGGNVPEEVVQAAWRSGRRRDAARRVRRSAGPGLIQLKDVVKGGIAERFARFRAMASAR